MTKIDVYEGSYIYNQWKTQESNAAVFQIKRFRKDPAFTANV